MREEARKIDANRHRLLTAGRSLAALGAVGLDPVVQQAQAQATAPATAGKNPAEQEPEPQQRIYLRAPAFRKRFGLRTVRKTSKAKTQAGRRASFAINQATGKVRTGDA